MIGKFISRQVSLSIFSAMLFFSSMFINAMEVPNVALGKSTEVSSVDGYAGGGESAVDGNTSTRWASAWNDSEWMQIDLGELHEIYSIILNWETAYGRSYEILISDDATNWRNLYSTDNSDGGRDDIIVDGSGRYVRLNGLERATRWGYSLWEFEIYGEPSAVEEPYINLDRAAKDVLSNGETFDVAVESNISWSVSTDVSWMSVSPSNSVGDGQLSVVVDENFVAEARSGVVTISGGGENVTLSVSQAPATMPDEDDVMPASEALLSAGASLEADGRALLRHGLVQWDFSVPSTGVYFVDITYQSPYGNKTNVFFLDDKRFTVSSGPNDDEVTYRFEETLDAGQHTVGVDGRGQWGWIFVSSLKITSSSPGEPGTLSVTPKSIGVSSDGGERILEISSNQSWSIDVDASWLSLSSDAGMEDEAVTISIEENSDVQSREAEITISLDNGTLKERVLVSQTGADAVFDVSPVAMEFSATGGSQTLTIDSNQTWQLTASQSWISFSKADGQGSDTIIVSAENNTNEMGRTANVTVSSNGVSHVVNIQQLGRTTNPGTISDIELFGKDAVLTGNAVLEEGAAFVRGAPSTATWAFDTIVSGEYRLTLNYRTPGGSKVNRFGVDGALTSINFNSASGGVITQTLQLEAGSHTAVLTAQDNQDWGYVYADKLKIELIAGLDILSPANFSALPSGSDIEVEFKKIGDNALLYSVNGSEYERYSGASPLKISTSGDNNYRLNFSLEGTSISATRLITVGTPPKRSFVKVQDTNFMLDGKPWYFNGTNQYYLMFKPKAMADDFFERAADLGMNVIRSWAFCHHTDTHDGVCVNKYDGRTAATAEEAKEFFLALKSNPTPAEQALLDRSWGLIDHYIAKAGEKGLRLVLAMGDNWPANRMGSIDVFAQAVGGSGVAGAYKEVEARKLFKMWISTLLNRVNSETNVRYKDDPTIMMWELGNEPRCQGGSGCDYNPNLSRDAQSEAYTNFDKWVSEMSAHTKAEAPEQLVSLGAELDHKDSDNFVKDIHRHDTIDAMSAHIYPKPWRLHTKEQTFELIERRIRLASEIKMPLYYGEFSWRMDREGGEDIPDNPTTVQEDAALRAELFRDWYAIAEQNKDVLGGMLSWQLSGLEWGNGLEGSCTWCAGPYGKPTDAWYGNHDGYQFYCVLNDDEWGITGIGAPGTNVEGSVINLEWHKPTCDAVQEYSDKVKLWNNQ